MLVLNEVCFDAFDDAYGGAGVDEISGADSDGGGTGDEKFDRVFGFEDASHADDGKGGVLSGVVHELDGDGFDGGAAESTAAVGENGFASFDIDAHGGEGVHDGEGVGSGVLGGAGEGADVGDVGGEFGDDGFLGFLADEVNDAGEGVEVGAEGGTAFFDVGAGEVDFVGVDAGFGIELFDDGAVFFDGFAPDVDDDGGDVVGEEGNVGVEEALGAGAG